MERTPNRKETRRTAKSILRLPDLRDPRFSTAFPARIPSAGIATPLTNSWTGIAPSRGGDRPNLTGERRRISHKRWKRGALAGGGKELFFLSPDRQVMAVNVEPGTDGAFGPPAALSIVIDDSRNDMA